MSTSTTNLYWQQKAKDILKTAITELNKQYKPHLFPYVQEHHKILYESIIQTQNILDTLWNNGIYNNFTFTKFRNVLKDWYLLHLTSIKLFNKAKGAE